MNKIIRLLIIVSFLALSIFSSPVIVNANNSDNELLLQSGFYWQRVEMGVTWSADAWSTMYELSAPCNYGATMVNLRSTGGQSNFEIYWFLDSTQKYNYGTIAVNTTSRTFTRYKNHMVVNSPGYSTAYNARIPLYTETSTDSMIGTVETYNKIKWRIKGGNFGAARAYFDSIDFLCYNPATPTPTQSPECDENDLFCKVRHHWDMDELEVSANRKDDMGGANLQARNVTGTEFSKYGPGAAQLNNDLYMSTLTEPDTLSIAPEGWSIAGWFMPQGSGGALTILDHSEEFSIKSTSDNKIAFNAGSTTITSVNPVSMDAWHLITVIFDGTTYKFQIDAETSITTAGTAPAIAPGVMLFGSTQGDSFSGRLDEWVIWERAITDLQRETLWNQSEGCFYPWWGSCNIRGNGELVDGGMEQYPDSTAWVMESGSDDFGMRINRNTILGWIQFSTIGPSRCGDGYHRLRTDVQTAGDMPISQIFSWMGGPFYWKVATRGARGLFGTVIGPEYQPRARVELIDVFTDEVHVLIDDPENEPQTGNWKVNAGTIADLPLSNYKILLMSYDGKTVDYDDVAVGTGPLDMGCSERLEPSPTPTQTATRLSTATPNINPTQFQMTATPGPSPTPGSLLINNCGFQNGAVGWVLNAQSYINSVGGPIGPLYLVAQSSPPGAYQTVYVATEQTIYLTAYVMGYAQIRFVNVDDNETVNFYTAYHSSWTQIKRTASIRSGYWRVELNTSSLYSSAGFDGIDVSVNGYTTSGFCVNTPTPGPTAYVPPTNTPTRTSTAVFTATAVYYTITPAPSRTPYGTPGGPEGPYTQTPNATGTAIYNATATAAAGTIGTLTPGPSATPGGNDGGWNGGDMPPGDGTPVVVIGGGDGDGDGWVYGTECTRPNNPWSVSWWVDYETCRVLNFVSIGPGHVATAQAIPTLFVNKEPIHTINQFGQAAVIVRTQVSSYNWSGTGGTEGTIDPQPGQILRYSGSSPWDAGGTIALPSASGNNLNGSHAQTEFSRYCNSRLSSALASRLAEGVCAVFNIYSEIGYLAWIQLFINIAAILGAFRTFLSVIGFSTATNQIEKRKA